MPEAAIRSVLEAKAAALIARDAAALAALIDDGFIYVNAAGRQFDKPAYINVFCTSGRIVFTAQEMANLAVRLIDGVAVATFDIADQFTIEGRAVTGHYRSSGVFRRSSPGWQWAAGQTTAIAPI